MLSRVDQMFSEISEGDRAAIELVYIDGLTFSEAARKMGIPIGSFKTRINRALHTMRLRLCGGDDDDNAEVA